MPIQVPDFDFSTYDPKDVWNFPAQRMVHFAAEAYNLASDSRKVTLIRFPHPDQRFVIFHEMSGLSHALMLGAMHLRSHGMDSTWWELQPELSHGISHRLMASNNMALRNVLHLGYVEGLLRQVDMAMRQYLSALQAGDNSQTRQSLHKVWTQVLETCECQEYLGLLGLLQIHRDALSQMGKFCPQNGKDLTLKYRGRRLQFVAGKEIDEAVHGCLDDWDFLRFLVVEVDEMLHLLHASKPLAEIGFIPTLYLG